MVQKLSNSLVQQMYLKRFKVWTNESTCRSMKFQWEITGCHSLALKEKSIFGHVRAKY